MDVEWCWSIHLYCVTSIQYTETHIQNIQVDPHMICINNNLWMELIYDTHPKLIKWIFQLHSIHKCVVSRNSSSLMFHLSMMIIIIIIFSFLLIFYSCDKYDFMLFLNTTNENNGQQQFKISKVQTRTYEFTLTTIATRIEWWWKM